jgi:hypothetical protein
MVALINKALETTERFWHLSDELFKGRFFTTKQAGDKLMVDSDTRHQKLMISCQISQENHAT